MLMTSGAQVINLLTHVSLCILYVFSKEKEVHILASADKVKDAVQISEEALVEKTEVSFNLVTFFE